MIGYTQQSEFLVRLLKILRKERDKSSKKELNRVKNFSKFFTLDEILQIGEDPHYYIATERFKREKFLMNPKNWDNCGRTIKGYDKRFAKNAKKKNIKLIL